VRVSDAAFNGDGVCEVELAEALDEAAIGAFSVVREVVDDSCVLGLLETRIMSKSGGAWSLTSEAVPSKLSESISSSGARSPCPSPHSLPSSSSS
jgi:hypothetical protein